MTGVYFALALICTVIGILAGLLTARAFYIPQLGAVLHIDKSNTEKDIYRIVLLMPFEEIERKKYIKMEIKKDGLD